MAPLSLVAAQTFAAKLTAGDALQNLAASIGSSLNISLPSLSSNQVLLSSAPANLADNNIDLAYPRICIYSTGLKNNQLEKFRSFSGEATLATEIWASGDLITEVDLWIHCYVEGVSAILRNSLGDWGNGMSYMGGYGVQFQPVKPGGLGFVQSAKLVFDVTVSVS